VCARTYPRLARTCGQNLRPCARAVLTARRLKDWRVGSAGLPSCSTPLDLKPGAVWAEKACGPCVRALHPARPAKPCPAARPQHSCRPTGCGSWPTAAPSTPAPCSRHYLRHAPGANARAWLKPGAQEREAAAVVSLGSFPADADEEREASLGRDLAGSESRWSQPCCG
jgi:hypothetical protein